MSTKQSSNEHKISPLDYICLSAPLGSSPEPPRQTRTRSVSRPHPCHLDKQAAFRTRNLRVPVSTSGADVEIREDVRAWKTR